MKHTHASFTALFIGLMTTAGFSQTVEIRSARPIVMAPPAIQDGSNWSRAPLPAKRQFDDIKSPDGQAIDAPAPEIEAVIPAPRVVIMQGATAPAAVVTTSTTTTYVEPALTPTGRATVVVPVASTPVVVATPATAVEIRSAQRYNQMTPPAIQDGSNWSRAPLPAKRQFDDVKSPDGQALDQLPEVPPTPAR